MGCCCSKQNSALHKSCSESLNEPSLTPQVTTPNQSMEECTTTNNIEPTVAELPPPPAVLTEAVSTDLIKIIYSPASEMNQCAYCNDPNGDLYDYFHVAYPMPCALYDEFTDAGWWRTGQLLFRPRFDVVCCPGYATRLPVEEYMLTKKHRRVIRKWGAFLRNGVPERISNENVPIEETKTDNSADSIEPMEANARAKPKKVVRPGLGQDPTKPKCKKSKLRKEERLKNKVVASPISSSVTSPNAISLTDLIQQEITATTANLKHNFEVKLVACSPDSLSSTTQRAYELYEKLQKIVHVGKVRFSSLEQFIWGFCNSCLSTEQPNQGSFHLQYFLDGELMMYSIVDITPTYFVSIYFVYDPDLRVLSPGIFTCLYEMSLVLKLKQTLPNMKYYGLGYYNHFDDKASYKRQFKPQQVLCNETNVFVTLESAVPKFLAQKYCRLADSSVPVKEGRNASIDTIIVGTRHSSPRSFGALTEEDQAKYRESLKQFVCEAGSKPAHQCCVNFLANY